MATEKNTEAQIIAAAKKIFMQKGLAGARMQDIADEAGINKAMLHYYYRSKDKLFEIIFEEAVNKILQTLGTILHSDTPFREMIPAIVDNYISGLQQHPFLPMFVLNELHQNPDRIVGRFMKGSNSPDVQAFVEKVKRAQQKGEIKRVNPVQLLLHIVSLCIFPFAAKPLVMAVTGANEKGYQQLMEERKTIVADFILAGLRP